MRCLVALLVLLERSWQGGVHELLFRDVWTFGVGVIEFQSFLWIKKKNSITFYFEKFITFASRVQTP